MKRINPYPIVQPALQEAWDRGFLLGFCSPLHVSTQVDSPYAADDLTSAFSLGVSAGQLASGDGWDIVDRPCFAGLENKNVVEYAQEGLTATKLVMEIAHVSHNLKFGPVAAAVITFFEIVIDQEVFLISPEETPAADAGHRVAKVLSELGVTITEIFIGLGADASQRGCEYKVTPLCRTLEQTRRALTAMGRSQSAILKWGLNVSGGHAEVVE